jgi:5-methyltetrahydrofolate corrinoid/iron sulfur protein methyltransferase
MALASGLDAAIMDPLDTEIMDSLIASEILTNRNVYCDSFLEAYRKR